MAVAQPLRIGIEIMGTCQTCKYWEAPYQEQKPTQAPPRIEYVMMGMGDSHLVPIDRSAYEYGQEMRAWEEREASRMTRFGECRMVSIVLPYDDDSEGMAQVQTTAIEYDELEARFETKADFGCNQWVKDEPVILPDYQE